MHSYWRRPGAPYSITDALVVTAVASVLTSLLVPSIAVLGTSSARFYLGGAGVAAGVLLIPWVISWSVAVLRYIAVRLHIDLVEWSTRWANAVVGTESGPEARGESPEPPIAAYWRLFSMILPRATRVRVFEPSLRDLLVDYLEVRRERGRGARTWLAFCFSLRTVLMALDCIRALVLDRLSWMLPSSVRRWWLP